MGFGGRFTSKGPDIGEPKEPDQLVTSRGSDAAITRRQVWSLARSLPGGAEELARRVGVTPRTVYRWIHDTTKKRRGIAWEVERRLVAELTIQASEQ